MNVYYKCMELIKYCIIQVGDSCDNWENAILYNYTTTLLVQRALEYLEYRSTAEQVYVTAINTFWWLETTHL